MPKVKICGLKRVEDAIWVNSLLPDYIGFVFAPSRRRVTGDEALIISKKLNEGIARVGVFVNPSHGEIKRVIKVVRLDIVQLHGDESPAFCESLSFPVWKAFKVNTDDDFNRIKEYEGIISAAVLDGFDGKSLGGTGRSFDWHLSAGKKLNMPLVLAGGLNSANLEMAYTIVKPDIVDVSTGVETDGFKDALKVAEFIGKVRSFKAYDER